MHQVKLTAQKRVATGKETCKKMRREGFVPGVIYGREFDNVMVKVDAKELGKTLTTSAGTRVIINLEVTDKDSSEVYTTMTSQIQKDIYKKNYIHVDFHKIALDEKVHADIPVILVGEALGVKTGGVMDHILWKVPVEALPLDLPEKLEYDVTHMVENDHVTVGDLKVGQNVEFLVDDDETIAILHPPRVLSLESEEGEEGELEEAEAVTEEAAV